MNEFRHYVRLDGRGRVVKGFCEVFEAPQDGDVCISANGGRHFAIGGEANPMLLTLAGVPLYAYDGGIVRRAQADIEADEAALPPRALTEAELLREGLLEGYDAIASVYEQVLCMREENLATLEALAELYEMIA